MADVNLIIKNPRLLRLLALECERLGLSSIETSLPEKGARLYIADAHTKNLPKDKSIYIGVDAENALPEVFLLSELRDRIIDILASREKKQSAQKKRTKRVTLTLDPDNRCVSVRGGAPIQLSPTEYRLFDALYSRRGEILTYAEADELIGGEGSNKVNVYICFLRKKLEAGGDKIIYGVHGKGFMIMKGSTL